jgi:hypothetical protein
MPEKESVLRLALFLALLFYCANILREVFTEFNPQSGSSATDPATATTTRNILPDHDFLQYLTASEESGADSRLLTIVGYDAKGSYRSSIGGFMDAISRHFNGDTYFVGNGYDGVTREDIDKAIDAMNHENRPTLVLIAGHGVVANEAHRLRLQNRAEQFLGGKRGTIDTCDLMEYIKEHLNSPVQFVVSSCYSGQVILECGVQMGDSVVTLSAADQKSRFQLPHITKVLNNAKEKLDINAPVFLQLYLSSLVTSKRASAKLESRVPQMHVEGQIKSLDSIFASMMQTGITPEERASIHAQLDLLGVIKPKQIDAAIDLINSKDEKSEGILRNKLAMAFLLASALDRGEFVVKSYNPEGDLQATITPAELGVNVALSTILVSLLSEAKQEQQRPSHSQP